MTLSLLLALLATATLTAVWGTLFGLIAAEPQTRARGWAIAILGVAVGIAACGAWHDSQSTRVISAMVLLLGCQALLRSRRASTESVVLADRNMP